MQGSSSMAWIYVGDNQIDQDSCGYSEFSVKLHLLEDILLDIDKIANQKRSSQIEGLL